MINKAEQLAATTIHLTSWKGCSGKMPLPTSAACQPVAEAEGASQ
jgi:hypothetical protein